jgi:hypothetical protein
MVFLPVLVLLFAGAAMATDEASAPAPQLVVDSFEHSFGKVKPGTPLSYTFEIENKGSSDLEIASVTPSCGCTKGEFDKLVTPGKKGKISLSIAKTEKYTGQIVKTASVATNDPEHKTFTLILRADFGAPAPATVTAPK